MYHVYPMLAPATCHYPHPQPTYYHPTTSPVPSVYMPYTHLPTRHPRTVYYSPYERDNDDDGMYIHRPAREESREQRLMRLLAEKRAEEERLQRELEAERSWREEEERRRLARVEQQRRLEQQQRRKREMQRRVEEEVWRYAEEERRRKALEAFWKLVGGSGGVEGKSEREGKEGVSREKVLEALLGGDKEGQKVVMPKDQKPARHETKRATVPATQQAPPSAQPVKASKIHITQKPEEPEPTPQPVPAPAITQDPVETLRLTHAASTLQHHFRHIRPSLCTLRSLSAQLTDHIATLRPPAVSTALTFTRTPNGPEYAPGLNRAFAKYEETLVQVLVKADAVESKGNKNVRERRRALVESVLRELAELDGVRRKQVEEAKKRWEEEERCKEEEQQTREATTEHPVQEDQVENEPRQPSTTTEQCNEEEKDDEMQPKQQPRETTTEQQDEKEPDQSGQVDQAEVACDTATEAQGQPLVATTDVNDQANEVQPALPEQSRNDTVLEHPTHALPSDSAVCLLDHTEAEVLDFPSNRSHRTPEVVQTSSTDAAFSPESEPTDPCVFNVGKDCLSIAIQVDLAPVLNATPCPQTWKDDDTSWEWVEV